MALHVRDTKEAKAKSKMNMLRQAGNRRARPSSDPRHIAEVSLSQKQSSPFETDSWQQGDSPEHPAGYIRYGPSGPSVSAVAQQIRVQSDLIHAELALQLNLHSRFDGHSLAT